MTTNQTIDGVPRELLEDLCDPVRYIRAVESRAKLRALLDAPDETEVVHEVQWNSIHGPEGWKVVDAPEYHRCTGPLWDRRITRKPAAQPQGEPVAISPARSERPNSIAKPVTRCVCHACAGLHREVFCPICDDEQPAPVAVPRLEMAHVVRAHMEIPGCPVLTSNQCHALAMKLNESLKPSL